MFYGKALHDKVKKVSDVLIASFEGDMDFD